MEMFLGRYKTQPWTKGKPKAQSMFSNNLSSPSRICRIGIKDKFKSFKMLWNNTKSTMILLSTNWKKNITEKLTPCNL